MIVRCRNCGNVIVKDGKLVNATPYTEWDFEFGSKEYVLCNECGHKIEIEKLRPYLRG